jgi:alpha-D-ribose 1-methylphosphonate 5-triphosphate synthase subunit PhnI
VTLFPRGIDVVLVPTMPLSRYRAPRGSSRGRLSMYVAVKGGERAIENAHRLLAHERRGDRDVPEVSLAQISEQLALGVDRVMTEGSLYDRELAALAIKQARGDMIEAIFLVRAFRATLPRFGATEPVDTGRMQIQRRISSTFKDNSGRPDSGADLRLHPPSARSATRGRLCTEEPATSQALPGADAAGHRILGRDGLIEPAPQAEADAPVGDLTRDPLRLSRQSRSAAAEPRPRRRRFSALARLSTQRGYGRNHPFAGEIRFGEVEVEFFAEDVGFAVRSVRSR